MLWDVFCIGIKEELHPYNYNLNILYFTKCFFCNKHIYSSTGESRTWVCKEIVKYALGGNMQNNLKGFSHFQFKFLVMWWILKDTYNCIISTYAITKAKEQILELQIQRSNKNNHVNVYLRADVDSHAHIVLYIFAKHHTVVE